MKVSDNISGTTLINGIDFNDLTSKQIGTIRAVDAGRVNYDNISERMLESVEDLQLMGFITNDLELTLVGKEVITLAMAMGGSKERRRAATLDTVEVSDEDVYVDEYNTSDDPIDTELYRINRFG